VVFAPSLGQGSERDQDRCIEQFKRILDRSSKASFTPLAATDSGDSWSQHCRKVLSLWPSVIAAIVNDKDYANSMAIVDRILILNGVLPRQKRGMLLNLPKHVRASLERHVGGESNLSSSPATIREFIKSGKCSRKTHFDSLILLAFCLVDEPRLSDLADCSIIPMNSNGLVRALRDRPIIDHLGKGTLTGYSNGIRLFGHVCRERFIELRAASLLRETESFKRELAHFDVPKLMDLLPQVVTNSAWNGAREVYCGDEGRSSAGALLCDSRYKDEWIHSLWSFVGTLSQNQNISPLDRWPLVPCADDRLVSSAYSSALLWFKTLVPSPSVGTGQPLSPGMIQPHIWELALRLRLPHLKLCALPLSLSIQARGVGSFDKLEPTLTFQNGMPAWSNSSATQTLHFADDCWQLTFNGRQYTLPKKQVEMISIPIGQDLMFASVGTATTNITITIDEIKPASVFGKCGAIGTDISNSSKAFMESVRLNFLDGSSGAPVYRHCSLRDRPSIDADVAPKLLNVLADAVNYNQLDAMRRLPIFMRDTGIFGDLASKRTPWFIKPLFEFSLDGIKLEDEFLQNPSSVAQKQLYKNLGVSLLSIRKFFKEFVLPDHIFGRLLPDQQFSALENMLNEIESATAPSHSKAAHEEADIPIQEFKDNCVKNKRLFRALIDDGRLRLASELYDPRSPLFVQFQPLALPHSRFWTKRWLTLLSTLGMRGFASGERHFEAVAVDAAKRIEHCGPFQGVAPGTDLNGGHVEVYRAVSLPSIPKHGINKQEMTGLVREYFNVSLSLGALSEKEKDDNYGLNIEMNDLDDDFDVSSLFAVVLYQYMLCLHYLI
jgi:hypothetical protein